ncbi:Ig-like domain-containing protein [Shewanella sp. E94]|uniref:beta strand repeat-containing protein n=1 Tax=Shewanella sp. E94 TaxID=2746933 RepID=UPI002DD698C6|nr:Ig-like domain-containing protein [Shewanella sp. E94]MEC4739514.1 Ig-like domain-containing protein [Shewanella sp. E94]
MTDQDLSGLADGTLTVTMNVTDLAGNTGDVTDTTVLDTTAPDTGDGENQINFLDGGDELVSDAESTNVQLSGQVAVGSTVNSITISDGTTTITVNAADISVAADGTVTVAGQDLSGLADGTLTVTMNVTDLAGNTGNVTDTTVLDTTAPGTGDGENTINFLDGGDELVSDAESTSVPLSGQVAVGSTVNNITISDGTTTITVAVADITVAADGIVTVTDQDLSGLADGTLTVTMNVTDLAGNTGDVTDTTVLDTTAPDTGDGENQINFLDGGDELVSDAESTNVQLSGQVAVGSTVNSITISDGTTTITVNAADISVAADGTVTVAGQDLSGLADGTLTVTMNVTDLAGNTGNVTDTTVLDTTAPGTGDGENTINFLDGGDELVSDAESGSVPLSGQVAVGSTVNSITISDGTTTITVAAADIAAAADGSVTVAGQDLSGLADGTLTVTMNITDLAGNTGNVTDTTVLDTTAPGTGDGENTINFLDGGDELVSDAESTNIPLSGQVAVGSTVNSITISDGTTTITVAVADITVAADGTVTVTGQDLSSLADGTLTVTMNVTDEAGNTGDVVDSTVLDTTAPGTGDGENQINFLDGGDELVSDAESTNIPLSGQVAVGSTVNSITISDGTTTITVAAADITVAANGTVTVTGQDLSGLADGTLTVTMNVTDLAGNTGDVTDTTVLDTTAPGTGDGENQINFLDGGDELVSDTESTNVPLSGQVAVGSTVNNITISDGTTTITVAAADISVAANGTVSVTGQDLSSLADGTLTVTMNVTDLAGNTGNVTDTTVLDTTTDNDGDGNTVTIESITNDTGSSSSDYITSDNTLSISGTVDLDDNNTLSVTFNGTTYALADTELTVDTNGNWTLDLTDTTLPDATYTITATVTDVAGNTATATQDVVVDTSADNDGDSNTVTIESITDDTGSSSSDYITSDNSLIISGTVDLDDNNVLSVTFNGTTYALADTELTVDANGNWTLDLTGTILPDATYTITATVTDVAGNTATATQDVVVDTTADNDGDSNTVTIESITDDTGSSSSDYITSDNTLSISGTVDLDDNNTLSVAFNGTTYTVADTVLTMDANGNWTLDLTGTILPDATYTITATVTDVAGNTATATQDVVVDTTADNDGDSNTVTIESITDDTGSSSSDYITSDNTLSISGTVDLDDNNTLSVAFNGTTYTVADTVLTIDANGNWTLDLTGTILPDATYTITATVTDVAGNTSTATQDVVVDSDTDNDAQAIAEDTQATGNVLDNDESTSTSVINFTVDIDGDGDQDSFTAGQTASITGVGTILINSNGTYTFTPASNWNGLAPVITYTTNTGDTATLTITVTEDNLDAVNDAKTITEDTTATGNVLTNDESGNTSVVSFSVDIDNDGDQDNFTAGQTATIASVGTIVINATGSYTFIPDDNWNGIAPIITYTTNTGDTATLTLTVTPVDDPVVANDDSYTLNEDGSIAINLLGNDVANDGGLAIQSINGVTLTGGAQNITVDNGTVVIAANGTMTFEPDTNFNGNINFDYIATDADGDTDTGSVTITVNSVNDPIIANDDSYTVNEDSSIAINLLGNDMANDGGLAIQSINGVTLTGGAQNITVSNGTVVIAANGTMTFVPNANFNGTINFDYVATDVDGDTDTGSVTITVNSIDDPVVANDDSYTVNEDGSIAINLLGNDVANDGGLAIQSINAVTLTGGAQNITVSNGTVVIAANGTMTFIPNANFNGTINFDYVATDADGDTDTGSVTITVNSVDDPVVANDDSYTVNEDDSIAINLLGNDVANDGGLALVSINGITLTGGAQNITVSNGTVVIAANSTMTFIPTANYNGSVSFNYIATDIDGDTDTGTVNITVNAINDDFTDPNEVVTIVEDTGPTSGNVIGGTTSVDGPVTVQSFTIAGDGTVYNAGQIVNINGVGSIVINANGNYTFTPVLNFSGTAPIFSYILTDGSSTDNSTLTINVTATDDPVSITTPAKITLDESELSGGTGTEVDPVVQTQQFTVSAPDGLNKLELTNGSVTTTVTLVMLLAATPAAAIVIEGEHGTLRITDYDASTGTVTYSYTLNTAQTHSLTDDELSDNFGVTAYDTDNDTSSTTLEIGILDDHASATLDTNGVDVLTDGFVASGIVGEWSSWTGGGPHLTRFDSNDNDTGLDQMRWGVADVNAASGYSFIDNDTGLDGVLELNQDIVLGDFTHFNFPVYSSITQATLTVNFTITDSFGVVTNIQIDINFDHNETPNNGDAEFNRDIINIGQPEVTFEYEGEFYTIKVLGFIDENGDLVTTVRTFEGQSNTYQLIAKVVEGVGYHLPNKEGNVLNNDLGSDGLTVVGVAFTNDDGTDIFTGVGSIIQGTYGNLVLNANGVYEYQLTAGTNVIPDNATDTFVYTIRDADGDLSTTKLIIGVTPTDFNGVPVDIDLNVDGNDGNDSIIVVDGENAANPEQMNVNFGGGLQGTITNQSGSDVLVTSGTAYSTHSGQNVSSGAGQDHIESGSGNDIVYAGSTGDSTSGNTDDDIELSTSTLLSHHIMTGTLTGSDSIIDSDGLLLSADVTSESADVINAGSGNDMVYGQTGSDIIYGHTGNDTLDGGKHNDAIRGGAGDDTIIGGQGDDVLRGDSGSDTFVWNKDETGTDHIVDFDLANDKLDLSDLLQSETADNLFLYLHFTINDATNTTTIDIDADHNGTFEQHIVLDGVDLSDAFGDTESEIINGLLGANGDGPLIINTIGDASSPSPTGPGSDPTLEENQVTHLIP